MHVYKSELSPVRESYVMFNAKSPYGQNFQNFGINIATNDFKKTLLKGMGDNVNCVTSNSKSGK